MKKKNLTWCHSGKSSEQAETLNMQIWLMDVCQTYQRGSKMLFWDKHVYSFDCEWRKNKNEKNGLPVE